MVKSIAVCEYQFSHSNFWTRFFSNFYMTCAHGRRRIVGTTQQRKTRLTIDTAHQTPNLYFGALTRYATSVLDRLFLRRTFLPEIYDILQRNYHLIFLPNKDIAVSIDHLRSNNLSDTQQLAFIRNLFVNYRR